MNLVELVTILLSLGGFGVQQNPAAPSPAEIVRLAPTDPELAIHLDLAALVPGNHQALTVLGKQLAAASDARLALDRALSEIALGRVAVKTAVGIDPITDLSSATAWVALEAGEPRFLLVVRGRFPSDLVASTSAGAQFGVAGFEVDGTKGLLLGELALAQIGKDVILGHRPWVEERMKKGFRRKLGAGDARIRQAFAKRPFLAVIAAPSAATRQLALDKLKGDPDAAFLVDLITALDVVELHAHQTGLGWTVSARDPAWLDRLRLGSEALFDLLRAQQFVQLALAKGGFAVLPSLRPMLGDGVDRILAHQHELLALVAQLAGDGKFVSRVSVDRAGKRVVAEASAASIGRVVGPMPLLVAAGALFAIRSKPTHGGERPDRAAAAVQAMPAAEPVEPPRRVLDVGAIHRRVKTRSK